MGDENHGQLPEDENPDLATTEELEFRERAGRAISQLRVVPLDERHTVLAQRGRPLPVHLTLRESTADPARFKAQFHVEILDPDAESIEEADGFGCFPVPLTNAIVLGPTFDLRLEMN